MGDDLLDKVPPALKSLWQLENELRSALQKAVFLRTDDASNHLVEARRHLEEALKTVRGGSVPAATSNDSAPDDNKPHDSPYPDDPVNTPTRVPRG